MDWPQSHRRVIFDLNEKIGKSNTARNMDDAIVDDWNSIHRIARRGPKDLPGRPRVIQKPLRRRLNYGAARGASWWCPAPENVSLLGHTSNGVIDVVYILKAVEYTCDRCVGCSGWKANSTLELAVLTSWLCAGSSFVRERPESR